MNLQAIAFTEIHYPQHLQMLAEGASLGLAENMDRVSPLILPPTSFFLFSFFSSAPLDCKLLQMQPSLCGKGRQMPCMNFTMAKGRRLSLARGDPCTEGLCLE